jgi:hypothetical protein
LVIGREARYLAGAAALHQIDDRQQNNGSDERGQQRQRIKRVCAQAAATDQTTEQEATED